MTGDRKSRRQWSRYEVASFVVALAGTAAAIIGVVMQSKIIP
ncbi:hypothetical protein [Streptomyces sp. NPDC056512]